MASSIATGSSCSVWEGGLGVHRLLTMSWSWDSWDLPGRQQPQQHGQQAGGQQGQQQPQQYGQQAWLQHGQQAWGQTGQQQPQQPQQHGQQAWAGWWAAPQVGYIVYPMSAPAPHPEGKGLSSSPAWWGGGSSMGHGQGRDKGHEQGKSNKGPEKGQDKGQ